MSGPQGNLLDLDGALTRTTEHWVRWPARMRWLTSH